MNDRQTFVLSGAGSADSAPIHGVVHLPSEPGPRPAVVICHGFKGFMDWGFFPPLADLLAERGFTAVRFNYSGCGMRPGDELVTDLDAFRRNTFRQELAETLRVLEAMGEEIAPGRVDRDRLALVGHSRGGGASILAAARPEWRERLRALVTWAAVSSFDRFGGDDVKDEWREKGHLEIENGRTGQKLQLGVELLDDLEHHAAEIDPLDAAGLRRAPWLILHGSLDEAVPVVEAEALEEAAVGETELRVVENGTHTFGARHPFAGPTPQLIEAMNATQTWLRRYV